MQAELPALPADLFDAEAFRLALTDGSTVPVCKHAIAHTTEALHERFRQGEDIHHLIHWRALFVDALLQGLWQQANWRGSDIALVAVGGYGRGELHPASDIDLLFLLPGEEPPPEGVLEAFLTQLWDIGLQVGHSVRTVEECAQQGAADITVLTNMMEARLLCGCARLFSDMQAAIGPDRLWPSAEFFAAKLAEQQARHGKFADTEYNLEPNVKSSPGGLRDVQLIGWVAQRHYGVNNLEELQGDTFLSDEELQMLNSGREFMWQVRYALHMITGREEDRLLFDHQRELAKLWGCEDSDERLAVEQFMQVYYRWAMALGQLNDVAMRNFDQAILHPDSAAQQIEVDEDFVLNNGYLDAREDDLFHRKPEALLRIFLVCAQREEIKDVGAPTLRLLREGSALIDDAFRADHVNQKTFLEILRAPVRVAQQLRRMSRTGILGRYLPEFGVIVGQMQHDLFHAYTVDAHTLEVVKHMRRFHYPESQERFPITCRVAKRLPRPELLYIAGLYHDIGKGRGGDHSELGAVDAAHFCRRHGLNQVDSNLVVWLVRNHLLMSGVAQRKDISDPDVIQQFASHVSDQLHLDYLFVLTVADINATNPDLWNAWRATLMRQLYTETTRALRRGLENPIDKQELIDNTRRTAMNLLQDRGFLPEEVDAIWEGGGEDYFLREKAEDIAWHTESIAAHGNTDAPLVLAKPGNESGFEGATQIFVHAAGRSLLFATICAELEQLDLSVQDARIYSSGTGRSLDTFFVLDSSGASISDDTGRLRHICGHLTNALLDDGENYGEIVQRRTPRQMQSFPLPTVTQLVVDESKQLSVLEVSAPDRPGLLARVGTVFARYGIDLQAAKIQTLGERVEDVFFITDRAGNPIADPTLCEQIQADIRELLDVRSNSES